MIVCIFSGGLDSVSTAAYLKNKGHNLYLLTFDYGQKARNEISIAKDFATILNAEHLIIDISFMKGLYKDSNVLTHNTSIPSKFDYSIVVPARNAIFLTIASALAFSIKAEMISYGAHLDDEQYYPDCRKEFAEAFERSINLAEKDGIDQGLRKRIKIWSPAMEGLKKSDLVRIGYKLLGANIFKTWSCYDDKEIHCGKCESCNNRRKAFKLASINDETKYALNMDYNDY